MKFNERLDLLLEPLTLKQKTSVRDAFDLFDERHNARLFLSDWTRIAQTAHQLALRRDWDDSWLRLFTDRRVRARRDRQLRQAAEASAAAASAIGVMSELLSRHSYARNQFPGMEEWTATATMYLTKVGAHTTDLRNRLRGYRPARASRGEARWLTQSAVLDVVAAYFRFRDWPIVRRRRGLFAATLFAVSIEPTDFINAGKLRRAANSPLDYAALEAEAPRHVEFAYPAEHRAKLRQGLANVRARRSQNVVTHNR